MDGDSHCWHRTYLIVKRQEIQRLLNCIKHWLLRCHMEATLQLYTGYRDQLVSTAWLAHDALETVSRRCSRASMQTLSYRIQTLDSTRGQAVQA